MIMTRNSRFGIAAVSATIVALVIAVPLRAAPPDKEVKVTNTPAEAVPVAVQRTPLQPVQRTELVIFAAGDSIKTQTLYSVPTGKRLVIEEASVRAQLFTGVSQAMVFLRSNGGGLGGHYVPLQSVGPVDGMGTVLVGTELLRGYADGGTIVDVSVTLNTASGSGGRFEVTVTGHLVDL